MKTTPTVPPGQIEAAGPVAVGGAVAAAPEGVLVEPITGQDAVWYRVRVGYVEKAQRGSGWVFTRLVEEERGVPFNVEDKDGSVRVELDSTAYVRSRAADDAPELQPLPPYAVELLTKSRKRLPRRAHAAFDVLALCPGDAVYVLGRARGGARSATGYRDGAREPCVIYGSAGGANDLVVSDLDPATLLAWLGAAPAGAAIVAGFGLLLVFVAGIVALVAPHAHW